MNILLLSPFFSGSHRQWAESYQAHSRHRVTILSLAGRHWKWRMYGGAVSLARQFLDARLRPDLILATDLLDLPTFLALTRKATAGIPTILYFHENQLTYPWSPTDEDPALGRDNHYAFINYTSALAADLVCFNSAFHQRSFLQALPAFLRQFPDHREMKNVEAIHEKSQVLSLGLDLASLAVAQPAAKPKEAVLLWNHRWEYDKDPDTFFTTLFELQAKNIPFRLIVLGEAYRHSPAIFAEARLRLQDQLLFCGYAPNRLSYARWLHLADIIPVTSRQDFFGGSTVEAIYCNCFPILPRRLAFPEHIPLDRHSLHLYETTEELLHLLTDAIYHLDHIRNAALFQGYVSRYDWQEQHPIYDTLFENYLTDRV